MTHQPPKKRKKKKAKALPISMLESALLKYVNKAKRVTPDTFDSMSNLGYKLDLVTGRYYKT